MGKIFGKRSKFLVVVYSGCMREYLYNGELVQQEHINVSYSGGPKTEEALEKYGCKRSDIKFNTLVKDVKGKFKGKREEEEGDYLIQITVNEYKPYEKDQYVTEHWCVKSLEYYLVPGGRYCENCM